MPNKIVVELKKQLAIVTGKLEQHLTEGVEVKLAIARLQVAQHWTGVLVLLVLAAIVGLYFKK